MKTFFSSPWKFGTFLGSFVFTLWVLSVAYAALSWGLTTADKVGSGSGLTATSWNRIINGVLDLDTRTTALSASGASLVLANMSADQGFSNLNGGIVNFNTTSIDNLSEFNTSTSIFTAASSGVYMVDFLLYVSCNNSQYNGGYIIGSLTHKRGGTTVRAYQDVSRTNSAGTYCEEGTKPKIQKILNLLAGDTVSVSFNNAAGTTLSIYSSLSYLDIIRIR